MASLDLFSDKSDLYAQARPKYPKALFAFIAQAAHEHQRAWDCAAGNGQAASGLAEFFNEVQATDISAQQISLGISAANINYSVQPAEHTHFENHYFDVVTVAQALHWFDYTRFWPEVLRVLKPNGLFAAWGYNWFTVNPEIDRTIKQTILDVIAPYWAPQNQIAWQHYRTLEFPFTDIKTPPFTITTAWNLSELLNYMHTWSATRQCMQQQGDAFFNAAATQLKKVWGDEADRKAIHMDIHCYLGRAPA